MLVTVMAERFVGFAGYPLLCNKFLPVALKALVSSRSAQEPVLQG